MCYPRWFLRLLSLRDRSPSSRNCVHRNRKKRIRPIRKWSQRWSGFGVCGKFRSVSQSVRNSRRAQRQWWTGGRNSRGRLLALPKGLLQRREASRSGWDCTGNRLRQPTSAKTRKFRIDYRDVRTNRQLRVIHHCVVEEVAAEVGLLNESVVHEMHLVDSCQRHGLGDFGAELGASDEQNFSVSQSAKGNFLCKTNRSDSLVLRLHSPETDLSVIDGQLLSAHRLVLVLCGSIRHSEYQW